jgi:RNA polymerase sigma factor (sigma-70 family)
MKHFLEEGAVPFEDAGTVTIRIGDLQNGGDAEAAAQSLWERYFDELVRLARARIQRKWGARRGAADEQDAALDALNSVILRLKRGQFPELKDRDDLWRLLVVITKRKVDKQVRAEMADKRGGGKVVSGEALPDHIDLRPSPEFAASMAEEVDRLIKMLPSETLRTIAKLKLEGLTDKEVAEKIGCTRETVSRKLKLIRKYWAKEIEDEDHTTHPTPG